MTMSAHMRHFKIALKNGWTAALLGITACSNPFSHGPQPLTSNFHAVQLECNQIDLGLNRVSVGQIRAIVGCLNTAHELEALNETLSRLSDSDLSPLVDWINETIQERPQVLYAFRKIYARSKSDQKIVEVEKLIQLLLNDPVRNQNAVEAFKKITSPFLDLIFDEGLHGSLKNIQVFSSSRAYQRLLQEYVHSESSRIFLTSTQEYLQDPTSKKLSQILQMLSRDHLDQKFLDLTESQGPTHLQNLSRFFEWGFYDDHFSKISAFLRSVQDESIFCFRNRVTLKTPFEKDLKLISKMNVGEFKTYFKHDLKNLILVGQGYCEFHFKTGDGHRLLSEAMDQAGFEEFYSFLQPLLLNDEFIRFITSPAAETWIQKNRALMNQHFFEDVLNLIALDLRFPLTQHPEQIAKFLDQTYATFSISDWDHFFDWINPLLVPDQAYGNRALRLLLELKTEFPTVPKESKIKDLTWIRSLVESTLKKGNIAALLSLSQNLSAQKKLFPLLDRGLDFFKNLIDKGRFGWIPTGAERVQFETTHPHEWLIEKRSPSEVSIDETKLECLQVDSDWNFLNYSSRSRSTYLKKMKRIHQCLNPTQTFDQAYQLAEYATEHQEYRYLLDFQRSFFDEVFALDTPLVMKTLDSVLAVSKEEALALRQTAERFSRVFASLQNPMKNADLSQKWLAQEIGRPEIYQALSEYLKLPHCKSTTTPTLDLDSMNRIDVMVTKHELFKANPWPQAVTRLFQKYCPQLNPGDKKCEIDADQVQLYRHSPETLIRSIKNEYLNSTQTWFRSSAEGSSWQHNDDPKRVKDFEYHLHPMLHQLQGNPRGVQSVFDAFKRVQFDDYSLTRFIQERATRLTLVPYVFQNPDYPEKKGREYQDHIRLRIVSDVDRLELIAINADFEAFGLTKNFGLGFIRDIALSWGDEPTSRWPEALSKLLKGKSAKTLKQTRDEINETLDRFDTQLVHQLGKLSPQGRDLNARLFNLKFMLSLLDLELPIEQGGQGGLKVLRDLFFAVHAQTESRLIDHFPDGIKFPSACIASPTLHHRLKSCEFDLLTLIPRVTRLGLLHTASLSILNNQRSPAFALLSILDRVSRAPALQDQMIRYFSSHSGILVLKSGVNFSFTSPRSFSSSLASLARILETVPSLRWVEGSLRIVEQDHSFIDDYASLLGLILEKSQAPLVDLEGALSRPRSRIRPFLQDLVMDAPMGLSDEWSKILIKAKPLRGDLESIWLDPSLDSNVSLQNMEDTLQPWLQILGAHSGRTSRSKMKTWIESPAFEEFCSVFSDTRLVNKTYNFLESIHQNPDSQIFLKSCREFLDVP